jgi:hypothetical protein
MLRVETGGYRLLASASMMTVGSAPLAMTWQQGNAFPSKVSLHFHCEPHPEGLGIERRTNGSDSDVDLHIYSLDSDAPVFAAAPFPVTSYWDGQDDCDLFLQLHIQRLRPGGPFMVNYSWFTVI